MNRETLLHLAETGSLDQDALDDLVYEVKSAEASSINNSGQDSQVEFLLEAMTLEEVLSLLGVEEK